MSEWNAGLRLMQVLDAEHAIQYTVYVFYPTSAPEEQVQQGLYELRVAQGAAFADGSFPLVVWSHGKGSTPLAYHTLACALARLGFVVAMPKHFGNNRDDDHLADSPRNLELRPRHVSMTIDTVRDDAQLCSAVSVDRVAVVGHSIGAYTALAVAGGKPMRLAEGGSVVPVAVKPDARVAALVLLTPAAFWFQHPESLRSVRMPVMMRGAQFDMFTPPDHQTQLVLHRLPDPGVVDYAEVPGAGHYSFLTVFSEAQRAAGFPPAQDPPGFDRADYHRTLVPQMAKFLRQ
jgi:predicted dienelactone hydrolase